MNIGDVIFNTMSAMEDEAMVVCIHCNEEWYKNRYVDGVCHSCKEKGLPGRAQIAAAKRTRTYVLIAFISIAVLVALRMLF